MAISIWFLFSFCIPYYKSVARYGIPRNFEHDDMACIGEKTRGWGMKDAYTNRQHVRRETRDFFTTFNKTLSTMYAFFYSNNLKVTYIRAYIYIYIYIYMPYGSVISHATRKRFNVGVSCSFLGRVFSNDGLLKTLD